MLMTWGQFITHDLTKASSFTSGYSCICRNGITDIAIFSVHHEMFFCLLNIQPTARPLSVATLPVANH
jgi:hypothetical protein